MVDIKINSPKTLSNGGLWNGVVLEKLKILELSEHLAYLYIELIENLSSVYSAKYDFPQDALRIILRTAIVPITHCFFERLIRLNKIVSHSKCKPIVAAQALFAIPNTIEEFQGSVNTQQFNQSVISPLSEVLELENINGNKVVELNLAQPAIFKNNLFKIDKNKFSLGNILSRMLKILRTTIESRQNDSDCSLPAPTFLKA